MADRTEQDSYAGEWQRLHAAQLRLRYAIAEEGDDAERELLVAQLQANREAIARLERRQRDAAPAQSEATSVAARERSPERAEIGTSDEGTSDDGTSDDEQMSADERANDDERTSDEETSEIDELLDLLVHRHEPVEPSSPTDLSPLDDQPEPRALGLGATLLSLALFTAVAAVILLLFSPGNGPEADDRRPTQLIGADTAAESELFEPPTAEESAVTGLALRVAIVAPTASDDMASTQSMVEGVTQMARDRGDVEITVVDDASGIGAAEEAIRRFAADGYDLVIAHDDELRSTVLPIAAEHPEVTFAVGPVTESPGAPNIYTYGVAAEEGGFVLGALAARLTGTGVVGAVGGVEAGPSQRYIEGFRAGADAEQPGITVLVAFTGSFGDPAAAAAATRNHIAFGADVVSGHGQAMSEAVAAASELGATWLGTQVEWAAASGSVAASLVYRWDVILSAIVADIDGQSVNGASYTANLANGGLQIVENPDRPLAEPVRQRLEQLRADIAAGAIDPAPAPAPS